MKWFTEHFLKEIEIVSAHRKLAPLLRGWSLGFTVITKAPRHSFSGHPSMIPHSSLKNLELPAGQKATKTAPD